MSAPAATVAHQTTPAATRDRPAQPRPEMHRPPNADRELGNLALQDLASHGLLRTKLHVGAPGDPQEAEADRMAAAVMAGKPAGCSCSAGEPPCPRCQAAAQDTIRRKPRTHDLLASSPHLNLGSERRLGASERAFFEPRYHADLSDVRIHDNRDAARSAAHLNARAFSLGPRIAFGAGEYRPDTGDGRQLLAHELAHVLQSEGQAAAPPTLRRDPLPGSSAASPLSLAPPGGDPQVCSAAPVAKPSDQVCKAPAADPANPTVLNLTGTLDERVASFKELVKTTAIHRLKSNKRNLGMWSGVVSELIPAEDLAALGMTQNGASRPYFELQEMRDPLMRELRANQAFGRFRACTGCHIENQIHGSRSEREAASLEPWATPNELRAGIRPASRFDLFPGGKLSQAELKAFLGDSDTAPSQAAPADQDTAIAVKPPNLYHPPGGTSEARLNQLFPDPAETKAALNRVGPIMRALGPDGYQVLPASMLSTLEAGSAQEIREQIVAAIVTRQGNYDELIGKINSGDIGYEHFGPIIKSLYPLADKEVRNAIQDEMDTHEFWAKVEQVVVATLTALALILTIFPPTTAAGIALIAALDVTLGYYGVKKGEEAIRIGEAYRLGIGADDVFTREQQQAGDAMVLMGFVSVATGYLGMGSGFLRMNSALARLAPVAEGSTALVGAGSGVVSRTIQQGEYVITFTEDGAMFVTVASRPDLLIMVRGETATLYQLLEGGGMRVAATATVPAKATASAPLMLTAGGEASTALVPTGTQSLAPPMQLGGSAPLMLTGDSAAASTAMVPVGPQALTVPTPFSPFGTLANAGGEAGRVLITPPPRVPLQLGAGNPTTFTWDEISRMRQPMLWQERETHLQEVYGVPGQQHFPVPGTGGRYVDIPSPQGGGQLLAGEAKSYTRWIGVPGQRGGVPNAVGLSERIQEQINRDIFLRDNVPGYDPRWMFTDAPPTAELRQALRDARIVFIEYLP